ncbi:MAG: two-component sensor histidine kinase, partial [Phototrophicales bacterium]
LTLGLAGVVALGIGSLASWTTWRMQQILVSTHKQKIGYVAQRFPQDVKIYAEMMPIAKGIQAAIDNVSDHNTLIWLEQQGEILAQSPKLQLDASGASLLSLENIPPMPE